MTGSGSPCGACKFLRRKCVRGCVFAPYFCHEQGAAHFSAIHKVFGASNVSKLLAHLPVSDRCEAAVTISYEAQARLQDPIYGCVSHIFALQQQVVNLQAQLAFLREQAAGQCVGNGGNPSDKSQAKCLQNYSLDLQSWFQQGNFSSSGIPHHFAHDSNNQGYNMSQQHYNNHNYSNVGNFEEYYCGNNNFQGENSSSGNYEEGSQSMEEEEEQQQQWRFADDNMEDLQSVAFRYMQH